MTKNTELLAALETLSREELRDLVYTLVAVSSKSKVLQTGLVIVSNIMTDEELGPGADVMAKMVKFAERREAERN